MTLGFGEPEETNQLASYLRALKTVPPTKPQALLVISAHWEEAVPTVMTAERPPLYYGPGSNALHSGRTRRRLAKHTRAKSTFCH